MATLYQVLSSEEFRRRPAMYLGKMSIAKLDAYITGYRAALIEYGIEEKDTIFDDIGFHDFVATYYNRPSAAGWANNIWAENYGDQIQCFKSFFLLFDKFTYQERAVEYYNNLMLLYIGKLTQETTKLDYPIISSRK